MKKNSGLIALSVIVIVAGACSSPGHSKADNPRVQVDTGSSVSTVKVVGDTGDPYAPRKVPVFTEGSGPVTFAPFDSEFISKSGISVTVGHPVVSSTMTGFAVTIRNNSNGPLDLNEVTYSLNAGLGFSTTVAQVTGDDFPVAGMVKPGAGALVNMTFAHETGAPALSVSLGNGGSPVVFLGH